MVTKIDYSLKMKNKTTQFVKQRKKKKERNKDY